MFFTRSLYKFKKSLIWLILNDLYIKSKNDFDIILEIQENISLKNFQELLSACKTSRLKYKL